MEAVDFDTVYREHKARVYGTVHGVLGPTQDLDDVVQMAFIEIFRSLRRFEGRSQISTWVRRIAVNVALQHIRRKRRKRWLVGDPTGDEIPQRAAGVDQVRRLEGREALERVYDVLNHLSKKKRLVWLLHELLGFSNEEVADFLDIPLNTVRSRLLAARRELCNTRFGTTIDAVPDPAD